MATIQVDLVDAARAVRPDLHRRGRPAAAADRHPPRDLRLAGAVHRHPRRALRRAPSRSGWRRSRPSSSRSPTATSRRPTSSPASCARAACGSRSTRSDNRMQNKIRLAQEQKVPYMVVLGDREIEARTGVAADAGRASSSRPSRGTPSPIGWPRRRASGASADAAARIGRSERLGLSPRTALCYPPAVGCARVARVPAPVAWNESVQARRGQTIAETCASTR